MGIFFIVIQTIKKKKKKRPIDRWVDGSSKHLLAAYRHERLDFLNSARNLGKKFHAVGRDNDVVFDAHTAKAHKLRRQYDERKIRST